MGDGVSPIAVLIEELRHEDIQIRLRSVASIGTIAEALGPLRTRDELIPYLQELVDDESEVLTSLAEQLGGLVDHVGGPTWAHAIIPPLEELASLEDNSIREKVIASLTSIAKQMSSEGVSSHFYDLIIRMTSHDWFARVSVCGIIAPAIARVPPPRKEELLKIFCRLCEDDMPTVRRSANNYLGAVAEALPGRGASRVLNLLGPFKALASDEQDSVRLLAVQNCMTLTRLVSATEFNNYVWPVIEACGTDKAWLVRYMLADYTKDLADSFSCLPAPTQTTVRQRLMQLYTSFLKDSVAEVRTVAATKVNVVLKACAEPSHYESVLAALAELVNDPSKHVRAAMASSLLSLGKIIGRSMSVHNLLTIFLQLLRDEFPDVRLQLLSTIQQLSSVLSVESLAESIMPSIVELTKDRQWRVRLSVLEQTPHLANIFGASVFNLSLVEVCLDSLSDPVFAVREAASINAKRLTQELGVEWSTDHVIPRLQTLSRSTNYLYRVTVLLTISALGDVVGDHLLKDYLLPLAEELAVDAVPNVRLNTARTLQHLSSLGISAELRKKGILPCLRKLADDSDEDVRYFASQAVVGVTSRVSVPGTVDTNGRL